MRQIYDFKQVLYRRAGDRSETESACSTFLRSTAGVTRGIRLASVTGVPAVSSLSSVCRISLAVVERPLAGPGLLVRPGELWGLQHDSTVHSTQYQAAVPAGCAAGKGGEGLRCRPQRAPTRRLHARPPRCRAGLERGAVGRGGQEPGPAGC